jgi:hypothetical protein
MEAVTAPPPARTGPARVALAVALVLLGYGTLRFLLLGGRALTFPWELDYGEGIVWQQMAQIFSGRGYGPIDGFPAIVFHYPPVFHAFAWAVAATGLDALAAGRLVSLAATLACALLVGSLTRRLAGSDRAVARGCGLVAGLVALNFWPVSFWAPLMRVDMLAFAFGLAGLRFAQDALERPGRIYAASLCFVAAIFTKQTSIAAPAAAFLVLLFARPGTAWRGIAACLALGGAALAALAVATDGGFLRHVFLYNINRADWSRLGWIAQQGTLHLGFAAAALLGLVQALRERRRDPAMLMAVAWLATTTATLLLVAKSGSSLNYFIEWMLALSVFAGLAVRDTVAAALGRAASPSPLRTLAAAALGVQVLIVPASPPWAVAMSPARRPALERLAADVHASPKPIISDDMVLLRRAGRDVLWEPAIFAELASEGAWDERPFVAAIRARRFGFFVTVGDRGSRLYDSRYTPAVADAVDAAYPVKSYRAGYVIHLPAEVGR